MITVHLKQDLVFVIDKTSTNVQVFDKDGKLAYSDLKENKMDSLVDQKI
jgi:hypothetical protein